MEYRDLKNLKKMDTLIVFNSKSQRYNHIFTYEGANAIYRTIKSFDGVHDELAGNFLKSHNLYSIVTEYDKYLKASYIDRCMCRFYGLDMYLNYCLNRGITHKIKYNCDKNPHNLPDYTLQYLFKESQNRSWLFVFNIII